MNHNHSNGDVMKRMLLMLACCVIPIVGILAIGVFGISIGPLDGLLRTAIALLCPLMMLFMMRSMMQGQGQADHHHQELKQKLPPAMNQVATEPPSSDSTDGPHCH